MFAGVAGGVVVLTIFILFGIGDGGSDVFSNDTINRTTVQPEEVSLYRTAYKSIPQDVDFVDAADRTVNAVVHIRTEMLRRTDSYDDFLAAYVSIFTAIRTREGQTNW